MGRKHKIDDARLFSSDVCAFCGISDDNELLYGKFLQKKNLTLHNNCLYLASGLCQCGDENEGILGFMLPDIEQELLRGKKLLCSYCRKRGATIGCVSSKCKKSFHLPCGIKHNSLHQFFGSFKSFCQDHSPKQKVMKIPDDISCQICFDKFESDEVNTCLRAPCCNGSWFHKICLQKYALSAGLFFFNCPMCKNSEEFVKTMETYGICIPEKDASWELEENAYQELLVRPECDANNCRCNQGRKYSSEKNSIWKLLPCMYCGFHARHKLCGKVKLSVNTWICSECKALDKKFNQGKLPSDFSLGSSSSDEVKHPVVFNVLSSVDENVHDMKPENLTDDIFDGVPLRNAPRKCFVSIEYFAEKNDSKIKKDVKFNVKEELSNVSQRNMKSHTDILNFENSKSIKIDENSGTNLPNALKLEEANNAIQIKILDISSDSSDSNEMNVINISPNSMNVLSKSKYISKSDKVKKRKVEHVCISDSCSCLKKYFKQAAGKYRL